MKKSKISYRALAVSVAIPLIAGALSGLISRGGMEDLGSVNMPPLSPPAWLFPVVWTILYTVMGIASYLVYASSAEREAKSGALLLYGIQLAFNFLWSVWFFNFMLFGFSFVWLLALFALIIVTAVRFYRIVPAAGYLMIPYIAWVGFAGYLNLGIAVLN